MKILPLGPRGSKRQEIVRIVILLALGFIIDASGYWAFTRPRIIPGSQIKDLIEEGPGIIPVLARQLTAEPGPMAKRYAAYYPGLPAWAQRHLPAPINYGDARRQAIFAIVQLGPLAIRRAAPQVIAAMRDPDLGIRGRAMVAATWLIPESKEATSAFLKAIEQTNAFAEFFDDGGFYSRYRPDWPNVWSALPQTWPILAKYLSDPACGSKAAVVLGAMGTNAAPAADEVMAAIRNGARRTNTLTRAPVVLTGSLASISAAAERIAGERSAFESALVHIRGATPELVRTVAAEWNDPNLEISSAAARTAAEIGPPMAAALPDLIRSLQPHDIGSLSKFKALGRIGPPAQAAAPQAFEFLKMLSAPRELRTPSQEGVKQLRDWKARREDFAIDAKIALCRMRPDLTSRYLPSIAAGLGRPCGAFDYLTNATFSAGQLSPVLTPLLQSTNTWRKRLAAWALLVHDPEQPPALEVMRALRRSAELSDRLFAARVLYETRHERNGYCRLLTQALDSPVDAAHASAAMQDALRMGKDALPALPAIKRALWHGDFDVRIGAGAYLMRWAPSALPPIASR